MEQEALPDGPVPPLALSFPEFPPPPPPPANHPVPSAPDPGPDAPIGEGFAGLPAILILTPRPPCPALSLGLLSCPAPPAPPPPPEDVLPSVVESPPSKPS